MPIFISRRSSKIYEKFLQSIPTSHFPKPAIGQTGVLARSILALGPYIWNSSEKSRLLQGDFFFFFLFKKPQTTRPWKICLNSPHFLKMCQTTKGAISCLPQKWYYKPDDAWTMLRCKTECNFQSISAFHLYIYIWTYRVSVTSRVQHNHCPCLAVPASVKKCVGCSNHLGSKPTKLTIK